MDKKIRISVKREGARVCLAIKVPTEIEEFYKNLAPSGGVQTSSVWLKSENEGADFYLDSPKHKKLVDNLGYIGDITAYSNFGGGLISDTGKINIAPLRAVGASSDEGVILYSDRFDTTNMVDFELYIKNLAQIAKKLWVDYISNNEVKANITFEV